VWAFITLAVARLFAGDSQQARADHARASELAREHGPGLLSMALLLEAQACVFTGDLDAAQTLLAEAEHVGLPHEIYYLERRETVYGDLEMARGHPHEALAHFAASLESARSTGNELQVALDLGCVANALATLGQDQEAVEVAGILEAHVTELGGAGGSFVSNVAGPGARLESKRRLGRETAQELLERGRRVPAAERVARACALARTLATAPALG
jgi:tetratricopeptide (TPR) repeat protein